MITANKTQKKGETVEIWENTFLCLILAVEASVRTLVSPCGIFGGQIGTETCFGFPLSVLFSCCFMFSYI